MTTEHSSSAWARRRAVRSASVSVGCSERGTCRASDSTDHRPVGSDLTWISSTASWVTTTDRDVQRAIIVRMADEERDPKSFEETIRELADEVKRSFERAAHADPEDMARA